MSEKERKKEGRREKGELERDSGTTSLKSFYYYLILFSIWMLAWLISSIVPLKLLGVPLDHPASEISPFWLDMLYIAITLLVSMVIAMLLTNRIASKFMSKEAMIKIIKENFLITSPFYSLIMKDVDRIYQKKDT